ncbi:hypothetical protein EV363DRAFT_1496328 [Boletus edulis]|nr:hypothetical protein EV363DRAFT_1496328 [Boletus edulis]
MVGLPVNEKLESSQQQQAWIFMAQVTVNTRALVEKILARSPSKFIVFRELLQNSDDAGCDTAEIHFETAAFSGRNPKAAMNADASILPELEATDVKQWTFRNHGKPFTQQDWERLPRIGSGNPDPQKVGAFGVGFFSVFSVTERPCVSSGDREMAFWWDDENQLCYRRNDLPKTASRNLWTTFKMPLRKAAPMPQRFSELMQFLASSIVFMVKKSLGRSQAVPIPAELGRWSPKKNMFVESVQQYSIVLEARIPPYGLHETKDLTVFTANVDVSVGKNLSDELNRSTKKNPPSRLVYSLIYTGKSEYDQSRLDKRNYSCEFPYPFQGLHADLDGVTHAWIYIGHATVETTGIGGHMASRFILTIERERIDFSDINVATWNRELLYVGGLLCRVVYELELSMIQREEPNAGKSDSRLSRGLQERFLHVLKFFTFHCSTPESTVPELLADSFYGCSICPLRLFSSVGVREAPDVRMFHPVLAKFLKSLPVLSKQVTHIPPRISPRIFALIIAIDKYKSQSYDDLTGCKNDGAQFIQFLTDVLSVPLSHIVYLVDEQATRQEILDQFDQFLVKNKDINWDDPIIFFFAGYGSQLRAPVGWLTECGKIETLCTHDSWTIGDDGKEQWGISDRAIDALLRVLAFEKGNNITVVFDCCYPNDFTPSEERPNLRVRSIAPPPYSPPADLDRDVWSSIPKPCARTAYTAIRKGFQYSHVLLTACRPDESAFEDPSAKGVPGGLFTAPLIKCLRRSNLYDTSYVMLFEKLELEHEKQRPRGKEWNAGQPALIRLPRIWK